MAADRIIFIRHAEKPADGIGGIDEKGRSDAYSLIPRGWQRAGALVHLFDPSRPVDPAASMLPDVIYAAGLGEGSHSRRSLQTATPLAQWLAPRRVPFVTSFAKEDHAGVAADIATRSGIVLVVWEHKQIPAIAARVAPGAGTPTDWPERFDLMWICDRQGDAWRFRATSQALLAGDEPAT